jgi:hypothetical protein
VETEVRGEGVGVGVVEGEFVEELDGVGCADLNARESVHESFGGRGWRGMKYHGHNDPVDFSKNDFALCVEFFARVLLYFEVEVGADVADLLCVPFVDAWGTSWGDGVFFFFRHGC